ncbi:MAG TPA: homocysteine S-methyltransferase family protein, partial [Phycisphaerae bacterium]|nr:homocysteine S-methyltransferase family protein [Phycisphaerae bacterium]
MPLDVKKLRDGVTIADGAWGTELDKRGVPPGYCREEWNISHPDVVEAVAAAYVEAGSQIILTNTFSGNRFVLDRHGFGDRAAEFSRAGAAISRKAAGRKAYVFGSIGPSGRILMMGEVGEDELYEAFKTQAIALAEGGVDAIICETMTELAEALIALRAARENTTLPVAVSLTYDSGPDRTQTVMGVTPRQAAEELTAAGADIVGCNCGAGIENYITVTRLLRKATDLPIWVKANAGMPELQDGKVV